MTTMTKITIKRVCYTTGEIMYWLTNKYIPTDDDNIESVKSVSVKLNGNKHNMAKQNEKVESDKLTPVPNLPVPLSEWKMPQCFDDLLEPDNKEDMKFLKYVYNMPKKEGMQDIKKFEEKEMPRIEGNILPHWYLRQKLWYIQGKICDINSIQFLIENVLDSEDPITKWYIECMN